MHSLRIFSILVAMLRSIDSIIVAMVYSGNELIGLLLVPRIACVRGTIPMKFQSRWLIKEARRETARV